MVEEKSIVYSLVVKQGNWRGSVDNIRPVVNINNNTLVNVGGKCCHLRDHNAHDTALKYICLDGGARHGKACLHGSQLPRDTLYW
jgi:hypothetical protein